MPSPSTTTLGLRPELGTEFAEFQLMTQKRGLIAYRALPVIDVPVQSAPFPRLPIEELMKRQSAARADDGAYSRSKMSFTSDNFNCVEYGLEEPVDRREAAIYKNWFPAEQTATARCINALMTEAELRVAGKLFNSTTWSGSSLTTGITNEWDDFANADPVGDVIAAAKKVYQNCGTKPNALIINWRTFMNLKNCDGIIDRVAAQGAGKPTGLDDIDEATLARVFGLKYLLVGAGSYNSAKEGQTAVMSPIWSDEYAMVCCVPESPDLKEACIGRTFHFTEDGSQIGGMVEVYEDKPKSAIVVRVRHDVDEKVIYPEAGHLLSNITT